MLLLNFCKKWHLGHIQAARELVPAVVSCLMVSDSLRADGLYSLPGSSLHGILQARILEWVAISFSRESSQPRDQTWVSCIEGRCFTFWATRRPWSLQCQMPKEWVLLKVRPCNARCQTLPYRYCSFWHYHQRLEEKHILSHGSLVNSWVSGVSQLRHIFSHLLSCP